MNFGGTELFLLEGGAGLEVGGASECTLLGDVIFFG